MSSRVFLGIGSTGPIGPVGPQGPQGPPGIGFDVIAKLVSFTLSAGSNGNLYTFNGSNKTATLPAAAPAEPWAVAILNLNASALTVSPNGLTLNGSASSVTLAQNQGLFVWSDGANYLTEGLGNVPVSRQVIAGAGLTGGGDLSADRTLAVANSVVSVYSGSFPSDNREIAAPAASGDATGATDTAALQAIITHQGGLGGGSVRLQSGTYITTGLTGASNVMLRGAGEGTILKLANNANADVIAANTLTAFVVSDLVIDGNDANQTLTNLTDTNDTDPTKATKGIAFYSCTRCGVRNVRTHDTRFHGLFFCTGSWNFAHHVYTQNAGDAVASAFGAGVKVHSDLHFRGSFIRTLDCYNSGVSTQGGAAADDAVFGFIRCEGGTSSAVTINGTNSTVSNCYASVTSATWGGTVNSGSAALTVGHTTDSTVIADGFKGVNCELTGSPLGLEVSAALGARFVSVYSHGNTNRNLDIFGDLVGRLRFTDCVFDTTTASAFPNGIGVLVTSSGLADCPGDIGFDGCSIRNSNLQGFVNAGIANVRFRGGMIENNAGAGADLRDNTSLASDTTFVGTAFRDTRSGVSRTQTKPITSAATGGRNAAWNISSVNHLTTDAPAMTGSSEAYTYVDTAGVYHMGGGITTWPEDGRYVQQTAQLMPMISAYGSSATFALPTGAYGTVSLSRVPISTTQQPAIPGRTLQVRLLVSASGLTAGDSVNLRITDDSSGNPICTTNFTATGAGTQEWFTTVWGNAPAGTSGWFVQAYNATAARGVLNRAYVQLQYV